MEPTNAAFAGSRVALGLVALARPGPVGRFFGLGDDPSARLAGRYLGGRDLVLGLGMILGERHGSARGWYEGAALVDFLDAGITVAAGRQGVMSRRHAALVAGLAAANGAIALYLARGADRGPDAAPDRVGA